MRPDRGDPAAWRLDRSQAIFFDFFNNPTDPVWPTLTFFKSGFEKMSDCPVLYVYGACRVESKLIQT